MGMGAGRYLHGRFGMGVGCPVWECLAGMGVGCPVWARLAGMGVGCPVWAQGGGNGAGQADMATGLAGMPTGLA